MSEWHRACHAELLPGYFDAFELAALWRDDARVALLESTDTRHPSGRWNILGVDPFWVFRSRRGRCHAGPPGAEVEIAAPPLTALADLLERYGVPLARSPLQESLPDVPFHGGAIGYLGYELLYLLEDIPDLGRDDQPVPDCYLMFFHTVLVCDARHGALAVISNGFDEDAETADALARQRVEQMVGFVRAGVAPRAQPVRARRPQRPRLREEDVVAAGFRPVVPQHDYIDLVEVAKEHIRAGDVFEVCTCNRFDGTFEGSGFELYGALRQVNPAPFAAWLRLPGVEVMSASPERFLKLDAQRQAESRPIKGTRPRGQTPEEDERLKQDLSQSAKDLAENVMIVDLVRNDFGRVCEFNSVHVSELQVIETFEFTHQMVSTIRGRLRDGLGALDLIAAAFPPGSMTGAPKIEAMKIIDRLEPVKRGIFSGSIGYLDFSGTFDLNIVIRTLIKKGTTLNFHVGGAIVSDSDATEEHQEIIDKASGMIAAVQRHLYGEYESGSLVGQREKE